MQETSYIKNPLTVIAIFAGLAELGGTAVLPALAKETQQIYVWFLMLFPPALVGLFFHMLWYRHTHLYAPSDFKDESNFVTAATRDVIRKIEQDALEASSEAAPEVAEPVPVDNQAEQVEGVTSNVAVDDGRVLEHTSITASNATRIGAYYHLEQRALTFVSPGLGKLIGKSVAPSGLPNVVFDAVFKNENKTTVVEVKFTRTGMLTSQSIHRTFSMVNAYYGTLPADERTALDCLFVVVFDGEHTHARRERLKQRIFAMSHDFPFRVTLRFLDAVELQEGGHQMTIFD